MACPNSSLKAPLSTFYAVICSRNFINSFMKHVTQCLCKKRCPSRCVSTKPTNVGILKIINDLIVSSIITILFKTNFGFIRWNKCQCHNHSKCIGKLSVIDVSLLKSTSLNSFPQIRSQIKEAAFHFFSFKRSSSSIDSCYFKIYHNILG